MSLTRHYSSRAQRRLVSAFLVDVCRTGGTPAKLRNQLRELPDELIHAARFHRIAPLVANAVRQDAPEFATLLHADRIRAALGHLQACAALRQLGSAIPHIPWVTFKGPVFAELAHPQPGLRSYNDVDVLVAHSDLREVSDRLAAAGWRLADYQDMLRNTEVPGEMHWISPSGALVDLHWSMINMSSRRKLFQVSTTQLLARRVPVSLGSNPAWALDPVDSLVHACLHAALTGANKLIYLVDVDQLSRSITRWPEVAERAMQWRAQAQVSLVLARARRVLGTTLPHNLDDLLAVPRPLRGLMSVTDQLAPVAQVRSTASLTKFIARAVQPGVMATVQAAGRNGMRAAYEKLRPELEGPCGRLRADGASLEAYLAAVEVAAQQVTGCHGARNRAS